MNHKLELMDQFDDAAFALMMDEYAEAEGERLRAEFEETMRSGTAPACPPELDEKCRKQIKRHFGKQRRSAWAGIARHAAGRAAACLLIALGISAALVMSVDALRIPLINHLIEHHGLFSSINVSDNNASINEESSVGDPIRSLVPDAYSSIYFMENEGLINSGYVNEQGSSIYFDMIPGTAAYQFDTEKATYEYVIIYGHEVMLIEKEGLQAVWLDANETTIFSLIASDMSKEEFSEIIAGIIQIFG